MNKIQSAVITPILAAGSVASPYNFLINITQRLCYPACADGADGQGEGTFHPSAAGRYF